MSEKQVQDLKSLFSEDHKIKIAGTDIVIKEIKFGDLPAILGLVDKLFGESLKVSDNKEIALAINKALVKDFDSVVKLLVTLTDLKEDQVKKLNPAATIRIIEGIVGVNIDFLLQHVLPSVKSLVERLTGTFKSKDSLTVVTAKKK